MTKTRFEGEIDPSDTRSELVVLPTGIWAAALTGGHGVDPIIGQVDQPICCHDGQLGAGVAEPTIGQDD